MTRPAARPCAGGTKRSIGARVAQCGREATEPTRQYFGRWLGAAAWRAVHPPAVAARLASLVCIAVANGPMILDVHTRLFEHGVICLKGKVWRVVHRRSRSGLLARSGLSRRIALTAESVSEPSAPISFRTCPSR